MAEDIQLVNTLDNNNIIGSDRLIASQQTANQIK